MHILARTYHWPPESILALTWRRRRRFLALVEADHDAGLLHGIGGS